MEINVELLDGAKGKILSICGSIWNPRGSDIYSGGQNIDEIAKIFSHNKKVQKIREIWDRWHLNDMRTSADEKSWEFEEIPADVLSEIESW